MIPLLLWALLARAEGPAAPPPDTLPLVALRIILPQHVDTFTLVASFGDQPDPSVFIDDGSLAFDLPGDRVLSALTPLAPTSNHLVISGVVDGVTVLHEEEVDVHHANPSELPSVTWIARNPTHDRIALERTLGSPPREPLDLVGAGASGLLAQWGLSPVIAYSGWALVCALFAFSARAALRAPPEAGDGT